MASAPTLHHDRARHVEAGLNRMASRVPTDDGSKDLVRAAGELAVRVPSTLAPLARMAFNYWWSWAPGGPDLFRGVDAERFELTHQNPGRLLREAPPAPPTRGARGRGFLGHPPGMER